VLEGEKTSRSYAIRALFVVLAAAGLLWCSAEPALATHVSCGDVVTQSVKLDSDLVNCPGDGLVVGADGITIDLNGHKIAGDLPGLSGAGIANRIQYDRIVVENGTIMGFFDGVLMERSSGSAIRQLAVSNTIYGLHLLNSPGLELPSAPGSTIEKNSISDAQNGIFLQGDSDRNRVEKNDVSGANTGIDLEGAGQSATQVPDANLVDKNDLRGNGIGIILGLALRNRIEKNLLVDSGISIFVLGADQNVIESNDVSNGSGFGNTGIELFQSNDNRLAGNRIQNQVFGIYVVQGSARTIVESNTASRSADDGIHVDDPATTLTGNTANDNGDLGIEAVPGVTDGGGNRARGNGNPAQCVNVACR
jgi:parallel beta-helix repeat protein